jgi:hypothetical protein
MGPSFWAERQATSTIVIDRVMIQLDDRTDEFITVRLSGGDRERLRVLLDWIALEDWTRRTESQAHAAGGGKRLL